MVITWWAYLFDLESSIPFHFLIFSFILNFLHFLLHFFHYLEGRSNPAYFAWKEKNSFDDSYLLTSSSSSGSVLERSDELATRRVEQESLRNDKKDADDPLADLPFWLKDFTDNLEPTEVHAPALISQDSDSEHPTNVVPKSRRQSIYTHFPKDRNCDVCLRTKITKASCRRRTGEVLPRAEKVWCLDNSGSQSPQRGGEFRDNQRYAVVVQDLATQWIQSDPCKATFSHETEFFF